MSLLFQESKPVSYSFLALLLTWSGLIILISMYFPIPLTSTFMATFSISETQAVWIGSIFSLCYAICCFIYGPLSAYFGLKNFLLFGITFLTITTFIGGFVDSYYLLLVIRVLQAIAAAAFVPLSLVYTAVVFPPERHLKTIGLISFGFLIASVAAQVFAELVQKFLGFQWIFIILASFYLITMIFIFYLPKDPTFAQQEPLIQKYIKMKDFFFNTQLCICFTITFFLLFSLIGMYTLLGNYLASAPYHFSDAQILAVRALGLIGVSLSIFANRISNKFGILTTLQNSLLIGATSLLIMAISASSFFTIIFSLLFVASIALIVPINIIFINHYAGEQKGSAVLLNAFILFVGASAGPLLATKLIQWQSFFFAFTIFSLILYGTYRLSLLLHEL